MAEKFSYAYDERGQAKRKPYKTDEKRIPINKKKIKVYKIKIANNVKKEFRQIQHKSAVYIVNRSIQAKTAEMR